MCQYAINQGQHNEQDDRTHVRVQTMTPGTSIRTTSLLSASSTAAPAWSRLPPTTMGVHGASKSMKNRKRFSISSGGHQMKQAKQRTVEVPDRSYQPSRAELREDL